MDKVDIREAYKIANKHAETFEDAVQVGIQMAINGEVIVEQGKVFRIE